MKDDLKIIERLTGISSRDRIEFNDVGWTSRVYLIDGGEIVFKFPRDQKFFGHEVPTLKLIKNQRFSIAVPIINWVSESNKFVGFYGVKGEVFSDQIMARLGREQKERIGQAIGTFIKQLHSITNYDSYYDENGPFVLSLEDEIKHHHKDYREALIELRKHLSGEQLCNLEVLFMQEMPRSILELGLKPVFSHGDLAFNNILIDNGEIGIIDFGDSGVYDESIDFMWFNDPEFLDAILGMYGENQNLRAKIAIRQKILPVLLLPYYIGKQDRAGVEKCISRIREILI